jgi:hypothetical protein
MARTIAGGVVGANRPDAGSLGEAGAARAVRDGAVGHCLTWRAAGNNLAHMRLVARPAGFPTGAVLGGTGVLMGLAIRLLRFDRLAFPLCTFKAVTGIPCMGCGSTRAVGQLARLHLLDALRLQPLATVAALAVGLWALGDLILLPRHRVVGLDWTGREARILGWLLALLALVNWGYLIAVGR